LRAAGNGVLRRIFGPKGEKVAGGWRKLHNEELHNLYASPNIIRVIISRKMRWAWQVARMGNMKNAYKHFAVKPKGKRPLGRPMRRWEDNIKVNLNEIRCEDVHSHSGSGEGPVVGFGISSTEPSGPAATVLVS
jgi:hypothetical protein